MIKWVKAVLDSKASPCFGRVACAAILAVHLVLLCIGEEKDMPWGWISCVAILFGAATGKEIAGLRKGTR